MTNEERFKKYVDEHCKQCKNKHKDLCDIRICVKSDIIETKCRFYERNDLYEKDKIFNKRKR